MNKPNQPERAQLHLPSAKKPMHRVPTAWITALFILLLCVFFELQIWALRSASNQLCIKAGGTPTAFYLASCDFLGSAARTVAPTAPRNGARRNRE